MNTKKLLLSSTKLYQEAIRRYDELNVAKSILERNMGTYPDGKIHIAGNKGRVQFYLRPAQKDRAEIYLSKKEKDTIKVLLQKKYDEDALKLLNIEIASLEKFLKKSEKINYKIQSLYSDISNEAQKYINPIDMYNDDYAAEWLALPYQKKDVSNNVPLFVTNNGEHVRSKSELMIANRLFELRIPYKYEAPLKLSDGRVIYPDFTVWNAGKRCEVYWEHRGMMDKQDYACHSLKRIKDYSKEGIFLGDKLIITEEMATLPLVTSDIDSVISFYFNPGI